MSNLVRNVTKENYADLGRSFIIDHGGKGFLIAPKVTSWKRVQIEATPAEWKAWFAYFTAKGIDTRWYASRPYLTVPAQWPHLFDADRTVASDHGFSVVREKLDL